MMRDGRQLVVKRDRFERFLAERHSSERDCEFESLFLRRVGQACLGFPDSERYGNRP
jgi:hypothetical protein